MPASIPKPDFFLTDPSIKHDNLPSKTLGLKAFLAEPLHLIEGTTITVYQMLHYVANVGGGTHQGSPQNEKAEIIHETADQVLIMGHAYPLASIRGIAQVAHEALIPLYHMVRA
jgi:hypothetical protein